MFKTYDQRYLLNENFVDKTKEIDTAIIDIGSEGPVHSLSGGTKEKLDVLGDIAQKHNAPIYVLEHRFYGKSQPFAEDKNPLKSEYLQYLSSRYAIADLINFINQIDKKYCEAQKKQYIPGKPCLKWIANGGSYTGAVSAWITQQHQSLFAATISSSGVVDVAFELPQFDSHTLEAASIPCNLVYLEAMKHIEEVTESGNDKYLKLFKAEKAVHADFYYFLADTSLMVFQYGDYKAMCTDKINPAYYNNEDYIEVFANEIAQNYSFDIYDRNVIKIDNNIELSSRQWWYQTCTEFAYFQPAPKINSIRSQKVTTQWHLDVCKHAFDLDLGDPTIRTNNYYGNRLVYGEDTFFSNFWQDIWHLSGLTKGTKNVPQENIGYIHSRDTGHCQDLHLYDPKDPQDLKDLRSNEVKFVTKKIQKWNERL